ncbi:MAG: hypothetical protein HC855_00020 [Rhizobiales bacterium]|nr:hypothetical protein [Hyphomicrobiales bacterium]
MMLFSDWARQQQGNGAGPAGAAAPATAGAMIAELVARLEQSLEHGEECRNLLQIAELRRQWKSQFESTKVKSLNNKIQEMEARLTSSVEAALTPLLEDAVVKRGIEDFCAVLQRHLQAEAAQQLVIKSPAGLRPLLDNELGALGIVASVEEHASDEVSTSIGDTEIETDIGAWVNRLRKVAA